MRIRIIVCFGVVILLTAISMCGCAEHNYANIREAIEGDAKLGNNIVIDGMDVSGMDVASARRRILRLFEDKVRALEITVSADSESCVIRGELLGISLDVDNVLADAASLTKGALFSSEGRNFECAASLSYSSALHRAEAASRALEYPSQNAYASFNGENGEFEITEGKAGLDIDENALANALVSAVAALESTTIEAPFVIVPEDYTAEDAQADIQLVSSYSTSFKGSSFSKANRVYNIKKAAGILNGVRLTPGSELSMNALLGPRNEENGWKTATGIREGVYVEEYGGGVCQTSSTLYNAALMANLTIVERSHHSWPLGYMDIGRDATISTDGPDLIIRNDGAADIFILADVDDEAKTVTVKIYGRPLSDGISIDIESKKVETLDEPRTETKTDPSLAPGETKVVREARTGSISETYKLYYSAEGELIKRELVSRDKYRSIKGLTLVGPSDTTDTAPSEAEKEAQSSPSLSLE